MFGVESRCSSSLFTRDASGTVNTALRAGINQGWQEVEGYDLGVNYRLPEFAFGRFRVSWDTTYVKLNNIKPDDKPDIVVSVQNSFGGFPRIRSNLSLDWTLGDFGATWTTRYYSSMKESCSYDEQGGPECNMPDHVAPDTGADPTNRVSSEEPGSTCRCAGPRRGTARSPWVRTTCSTSSRRSCTRRRTRGTPTTAVSTSVASTTCATLRISRKPLLQRPFDGPGSGAVFSCAIPPDRFAPGRHPSFVGSGPPFRSGRPSMRLRRMAQAREP